MSLCANFPVASSTFIGSQTYGLGDFNNPATEMGLLYRNCDGGYFSTLVDKRQRGYPLSQFSDVGKAFSGKEDVYVSQHLFRNPFRRLVNLSSLTSLFIDCDIRSCERRWNNPDELMQAILLDLEAQGLPAPSYAIGSGRGVHLKWLFERPMPFEAYSRWHRAQKEICAKLRQFGADTLALDGARLLRACGTINSKCHTQARVIFADQFGDNVRRHDADTLLDVMMPVERAVIREQKQLRKETKFQRDTQQGRSANLMQPSERSLLVISDLRTLMSLKGYERVPEGQRHTWLHIAVSAAQWGFSISGKTLDQEASALASEFCPDLPENELKGIVRSVLGYAAREDTNAKPFRSDTIIERLSISDFEQTQLRHLKHSSLRAEIKRVKRKAYDATRRQAECNRAEYEVVAKERRLQVVQMRAMGMTFRAIATQLGGTIRAVESLMRQAQKKGETSIGGDIS